jgi:PAS domain S-box-containing protein
MTGSDKNLKGRKTIFRTILLSLLTISLAPLIILSAITYQQAHHFLNHIAKEKLIITADTKASQIQSYLSESLSALFVQTQLKNSSIILNNLRLAFINQGVEPEMFVKSKEWKQIVKQYKEDIGFFLDSHGFNDFFIIDFKGNILFTDLQGRDLGSNVFKGKVANSLLAAACQKAFKKEVPFFSGFENYWASENLAEGFLVTLIFDENGRKAGLACVAFTTSAINKMIQSNVELGQEGEVYLIDKDLLLITSSQKTDKLKLFSLVQTEQAKLWQKEHMTNMSIQTHVEVPIIYVNHRGIDVIGIHKNIEIAGIPMAVITEIPLKEAFKNAIAQRNTAFLILVFTVFFVLLFSFKIARHITRPIIQLSDITKRIAAGSKESEIVIDAANEIGELAYNFNRMIIKQTRIENSLTELNDQTQAILLAISDPIVMYDNKGVPEYINSAFTDVFGWSLDELAGNVIPFVPEDQKEITGEKIKELLISGGNVRFETKRLTKQNNLLYVIVSASCIKNEEYKSIKTVVSIVDITAQKQLQKSLNKAKKDAEAADEAKSDFLANMSHEIRTPMNGIIGMGALLLDTKLDDEQREYLTNINTSAEALLNIINDILDFSKIESGKFKLEFIDFDLRTTIEDILDVLAINVLEKKFELACLIQNDIQTALTGDPGRLRQIIMNLAGNAMKFTETGGVSIHVSLKKEDQTEVMLLFEIIDTGIGISQENINKLFKSFSQADTSTTRKYGGTGLGLTISKNLSEMMQGDIGVTSKEGEGSTFWFTAIFRKQKKEKEKIVFKDIAGKHILIVDDIKLNQKVLEEQLKSVDCYTDTAADGFEALDKLFRAEQQGNPFDIAILDMQMPGMNGETLGKKIRGSEKIRDTILVMLTSIGIRGDIQRVKKLGFQGYLHKPIKQSQLFDCLRMVLGFKVFDTDKSEEVIVVTKHTISENRRDKLLILLVEDNEINQKVASGMLKKLNHSVVVANNGEEGVKAFEKNRYDLILMDIQMPVLDGLTATKKIRLIEEKRKNLRTPIIALTANAMTGDKEKYLAAGMDDYMTKPVKKDVFKTMIERLDIVRNN